ncbi:MAG TPA: hypothetical protein VK789_08075 [Bryobacteraceae bacterium]|nr:hypothetical protein [Bryobacteraceae bacterium]
MARQRSIEETFEEIQPRWRRGIPNPPTISAGAASDGSDFSTALSQAGQQIAQLQSAYQQQAALIQANTQAVQGNTSAQSGHSAGSVAGGVASSLFGGLGLGLFSPLISGIASLFGGGSSAPPPLPIYVPPSPVSINAPQYSTPSTPTSSVPTSTATGGQAAPQVTVNVNAMDSKSFMDHSTDIANAVREAMLNMHPINGVVASL